MPRLESWVACWGNSQSSSKIPQLQLFYSVESSLPAFYSDATCAILFDGFLLNREELLKNYGQRVSTNPNHAELILEIYRQLGEAFIKEVKGVFLLILRDTKQEALFGYRDRCGMHPFFYSECGHDFLFARSTEDLIRYPGVPKNINRAVVVEHLAQKRSVPEDTFFTAVKRIMPGNGFRIGNNQFKTFRYWYPFPADGDVTWISSEEDLIEFDSVFEQAISRVMKLGRPGIFLSGGLDSVSVACIATDLALRQESPKPVALSIGFPHADCNEEQVQRGVAEQLGLTQSFTRLDEIVGPKGLLSSALELEKDWSQPMWNPWKPLYLFLGQEGKRVGCSVTMTGGGGDDWLTVNTEYAADLIRYLQVRKLLNFTRNLRRSYQLPRYAHFRNILWKNGVRLLLGLQARKMMRFFTPQLFAKYLRRRFLARPSWLAADTDLRKIIDERAEACSRTFVDRPEPKGRYGFYSRPFSGYFLSSIASLEMEEDFESAQKIGIPVIHPYYDSDLIELLLRVTPELLQKGGMEKGIVRDAVARRFPDLKFERQKKVTARSYWQSVVVSQGPGAWERMGGIDCLIDYGIVDRSFTQFLKGEGFSTNSVLMNHRAWHLLSMEAWLRAHAE